MAALVTLVSPTPAFRIASFGVAVGLPDSPTGMTRYCVTPPATCLMSALCVVDKLAAQLSDDGVVL